MPRVEEHELALPDAGPRLPPNGQVDIPITFEIRRAMDETWRRQDVVAYAIGT